jgi:UDP-glucose 4-epimerase
VTKVAAEGFCQLFFREHRLPVIVLRTSRFFPEADDDDAISASYNCQCPGERVALSAGRH